MDDITGRLLVDAVSESLNRISGQLGALIATQERNRETPEQNKQVLAKIEQELQSVKASLDRIREAVACEHCPLNSLVSTLTEKLDKAVIQRLENDVVKPIREVDAALKTHEQESASIRNLIKNPLMVTVIVVTILAAAMGLFNFVETYLGKKDDNGVKDIQRLERLIKDQFEYSHRHSLTNSIATEPGER